MGMVEFVTVERKTTFVAIVLLMLGSYGVGVFCGFISRGALA
jgi:hypothetical protein